MYAVLYSWARPGDIGQLDSHEAYATAVTQTDVALTVTAHPEPLAVTKVAAHAR